MIMFNYLIYILDYNCNLAIIFINILYIYSLGIFFLILSFPCYLLGMNDAFRVETVYGYGKALL